LIAGQCESFRGGLDVDLLAINTYQADLTDPDLVVDPGVVVGGARSYGRSLRNARLLLRTEESRSPGCLTR
jgi:hypothetical protein